MAELFDTARFLRHTLPILRRRKFTYAAMDSINDCVFKKRKELEPSFELPQAHVNRLQAVPGDATSDSAQSEVDSDEDTLPFPEQASWINNLLHHVQLVFNILNSNNLQREFANVLANHLYFSAKQRTKCGLL